LTAGTMTEFQEKLRQQHEESMCRELDELASCKKDFEGFKRLFHRFLQVKGPAVDWAKISRPPEEAVSNP
uniref:Uncharacterized protein n=1 Tax=Hippocampus comes TaxID=109280 RepID=A0A3Q3DPA2_HIPCM